jgi:threonylcarbamoyladenosine tRNA methylthiotransferase MtaB
LNRFDTAAIEGQLARRGFQPESDASRAAVVIVNTCTVTGKADAEARRRIRGLRRDNPGCRLLVTGCYAELDADAIRAIDGVDFVFGNRDKPRLSSILDELGIGEPDSTLDDVSVDRGCDAALALPRALHFGDRSRALLKVQEGCRLACSYCIIPTVRGPSRSVPPDEVERAARALLEKGYREIVLTGVNVGDYGRDLAVPTSLAMLLRRLLAAAGPNRFRLNSLEPLTVTDEIVELMASDPRLAPHVQVPLQSGSPATLRSMRRNYRPEQYLERLRRLREAIPHAGLGADVIVAFPGETEERFRETYEFIAAAPLNYLHVFAWSPRPGTPAAALPDRVHGAIVRRRSAALRHLGDPLSHRFRAGFEGQHLDAVVLAPRADGCVRALTGNFIEVALDAGSAARGEVVRVRVASATPDDTRAVADGQPAWARDGAGRPRSGPARAARPPGI